MRDLIILLVGIVKFTWHLTESADGESASE